MEITSLSLLATFIASFLFTFYLIPIVRTIAFRLKIIDIPDGVIKKHKRPTPYLGGLAIYLGFLATLAIFFPFKNNFLLLIIGSTGLLLVGLIDDMRVLKPHQKLFGQIAATLCFLKAGFFLKEEFFSTLWHIPISFLWILTVINAFNLVDVMDGLATLLAIITSVSFLVIAILFGSLNCALLLTALLGPLIAFFLYNRPDASIYLGDAGSLFIGGILATIPFSLPWSTYNPYGYITPFIILTIPLMELVTLIMIRCYKRIPFYQASADHFSIYLQANGWKKIDILKYMGALGVGQLIVALLFVKYTLSFSSLMLIVLVFVVMWFYVLIKKNALTRIL